MKQIITECKIRKKITWAFLAIADVSKAKLLVQGDLGGQNLPKGRADTDNALVQEYYDTFHPPRVDPNENGVTIDALVQEYHNNAFHPPLVDPAPVFAPTSTTDPAPVSSTTPPHFH